MKKRHLLIPLSIIMMSGASLVASPALALEDPEACNALTQLQPRLEARVGEVNKVSARERKFRETVTNPEERLASRESQLEQTIDLQNGTADEIRGVADAVMNPQVSGVLENWADALNGFSDALGDRIESGLDEVPEPKEASWLHAAAQRVNLAANAYRATLKSVCPVPEESEEESSSSSS